MQDLEMTMKNRKREKVVSKGSRLRKGRFPGIDVRFRLSLRNRMNSSEGLEGSSTPLERAEISRSPYCRREMKISFPTGLWLPEEESEVLDLLCL